MDNRLIPIRKIYLLILITISFSLIPRLCFGFNYPPSVFGEKIDAAWREGNESAIPQMIETRLAECPNNLLALLYGYNYYASCFPNVEKAAHYRSQLELKLAELKKRAVEQDKLDMYTSFTNGIIFHSPESIEKEAATPPTNWKTSFPDEFPFSTMNQVNALFLAFFDPEGAEEVKDNFKQFQQQKLSLVNEIGIEKLEADTQLFSQRKADAAPETPEEQLWPDSYKRFKPKRIGIRSNYVVFVFWRMASTYDGMYVRFDDSEPYKSPGMDYEKLTNGVFWYHSSN